MGFILGVIVLAVILFIYRSINKRIGKDKKNVFIPNSPIFIACCFWSTIQCSAQEADVRNALEAVNATLKEYVIGTEEFNPHYMQEYGDEFIFKEFELSIDYPDFILTYTIGRRNTDYGGNPGIEVGTYKLIFPILSTIEYPTKNNNKPYSYYGETKREIRLVNETGLEKTSKGKKSIIQSFSFYGDEVLTTKKLAEELVLLQETVISSNFKGELNGHETTKPIKDGSSSKSHNSQKHSKPEKSEKSINSSQKSKSGKYGQ